jgi:primosomal protein N' (replication factor Y)
VVGTRSALLVPLPPPVSLALVDEADPAHRPPGHPRLHGRELVLRRAEAEGAALHLLAAAPSVETWHRALAGGWPVRSAGGHDWPELVTADTRRILRTHPLTLPLTRAIEDAARAGRPALLIVTRRAAALACGDCGALFRCAACGVPLGHARARGVLACALCGGAEALPDTCGRCGGRRLVALGWDAERVEASVRRRFPRLSVSRTDPRAQVVIGGPPLLRALPAGRLGAVGVVALDGLLGAPDFRAGERAFALLWSAAEALGAGGRLVVQTLHPEHEAIEAVRRRDRARFSRGELAVREQLGYPPYRRLCVLAARGAAGRALLDRCARALAEVPGLVVYPVAPAGERAAPAGRARLLVKGPDTLPALVRPVVAELLARGRRTGGMLEVEIDPAW